MGRDFDRTLYWRHATLFNWGLQVLPEYGKNLLLGSVREQNESYLCRLDLWSDDVSQSKDIMRNPVSPVAPCGPGGPLDPVLPVIPVNPMEPTGPVDPGWPLSPGEPIGPINPVNPGGPDGPVSPVAPVDPWGPAGPVNPVNPGAPVLPATDVLEMYHQLFYLALNNNLVVYAVKQRVQQLERFSSLLQILLSLF